jgi:hypothetical protein
MKLNPKDKLNNIVQLKSLFMIKLTYFSTLISVVVGVVLTLTLLQREAYSHPWPNFGEAKKLQDLTREEREALIEDLLRHLVRCESRGNPKAVYKVDRDGTPSWGILQFKPKTLRRFGVKYGFLPRNIKLKEVMLRIFDSDLQINTAREMIKRHGHKKSFWKREFPACSRKLGLR